MNRWLTGLRRSNFLIRLRNWEYWPFGILQFPVFIYFTWLAIKSRSLTFFAASNPGITMGGMFGESKFQVLERVPSHVKPRSILIRQPVHLEEIVNMMDEHLLRFPVIFKPDIGERGFMVRRISGIGDIEKYLAEMKHDFIIQEFVDMPVELGVFYRRYPKEQRGVVTSIVMKEMLTITGDGSSNLRELILAMDRAKLQWATLRDVYRDRLEWVPSKGESFEIVSIGNHCLGTKFLNGNHLITPRLCEVFDNVSREIDGFYFGRFDLRCASVEDLNEGRFLVLELNGCGAEPAHIYDPEFPIGRAVKTLIAHWKDIYTIAKQNHEHGAAHLPFKEALRYYRMFKRKLNSVV